jgi:hypothetical protein
MFPKSYFGARFFAGTFFPPITGAPPIVTTERIPTLFMSNMGRLLGRR